MDCYAVREPVGVVAGIPPFNFPAMIPLWMMPIAVACGNLHPQAGRESAVDRHPPCRIVRRAGLPPGLSAWCRAARKSAKAYRQPARSGGFLRWLVRGGGVGLPHGGSSRQACAGPWRREEPPDRDARRRFGAEPAGADRIVLRLCRPSCLAGSVLVAVGDRVRQDAIVDDFVRAARELKLGDGLDETATLARVNDAKKSGSWRRSTRGVGRRPAWSRRPLANGPPIGRAAASSAPPSSTSHAGDVHWPRGDFRPGGERGAGRGPGRGDHVDNRSRYGNSVSLFTQSAAAARISASASSRDARHQPWRAGADGVLLVRRLEEFVFRRSMRREPTPSTSTRERKSSRNAGSAPSGRKTGGFDRTASNPLKSAWHLLEE